MSFTDTSIHLKPLSSYSKMVCSKQQSASPCFKIQVHISDKTRGFKRRLQDSCFEDISETPLKKPCLISSDSPDEGCFSLEYQESSPFQKLIISKPVTPPRSTVNQPVTLFTSTPMSKLANDQIGQDRERLPSPIPILQWDRVVPSADFLRMPLNFDFFSTVPSLASEGTVKVTVKDVSEKHSPVHESKAQVVPSEIVLPPEEEETSCKNVESTAESFESTLPLLVQVWARYFSTIYIFAVCFSHLFILYFAWNQREDLNNLTIYWKPLEDNFGNRVEELWRQSVCTNPEVS